MQSESFAEKIVSEQPESTVSTTIKSEEQTTCFPSGNLKNLEKYTEKKPWLNADGTLKPDREISEICQSWNADIWEDYLQDLESAQREELFSDPTRIGEISAMETVHLLFSLMETKERPHFEVAIRTCLKSLAPQQKRIIEMRYWESMSLREIARTLGIKRQSVSSIHDQALAKLKDMLVTGKITKMINIADRTVRNF